MDYSTLTGNTWTPSSQPSLPFMTPQTPTFGQTNSCFNISPTLPSTPYCLFNSAMKMGSPMSLGTFPLTFPFFPTMFTPITPPRDGFHQMLPFSTPESMIDNLDEMSDVIPDTPPPSLKAELPYETGEESLSECEDSGPPPLLPGASTPPCKPKKSDFSINRLLF